MLFGEGEVVGWKGLVPLVSLERLHEGRCKGVRIPSRQVSKEGASFVNSEEIGKERVCFENGVNGQERTIRCSPACLLITGHSPSFV